MASIYPLPDQIPSAGVKINGLRFPSSTPKRTAARAVLPVMSRQRYAGDAPSTPPPSKFRFDRAIRSQGYDEFVRIVLTVNRIVMASVHACRR